MYQYGPIWTNNLLISQGAQGNQGNQGNQGFTGVQGNQGNNGAQGNNGTNCAQGAQGNQGNNGTNGAQGAQGNNGSQGATGPNVNNLIITTNNAALGARSFDSYKTATPSAINITALGSDSLKSTTTGSNKISKKLTENIQNI